MPDARRFLFPDAGQLRYNMNLCPAPVSALSSSHSGLAFSFLLSTSFIVCLDWYLSTRAIGCRWSYFLTTQIPFAALGLAEPLLRAVADTGYEYPTPIQAQAIPQVIKGGDLLAAAQTGNGKTRSEEHTSEPPSPIR